jgi:hypothetical protein
MCGSFRLTYTRRNLNDLAQSWEGKGDSHLLCEVPFGPFRQKVAVTFSRNQSPFPGITQAYLAKQQESHPLFVLKTYPKTS